MYRKDEEDSESSENRGDRGEKPCETLLSNVRRSARGGSRMTRNYNDRLTFLDWGISIRGKC